MTALLACAGWHLLLPVHTNCDLSEIHHCEGLEPSTVMQGEGWALHALRANQGTPGHGGKALGSASGFNASNSILFWVQKLIPSPQYIYIINVLDLFMNWDHVLGVFDIDGVG